MEAVVVTRLLLAVAPADTEKLVAIINRATGWLVGILLAGATLSLTIAGVRHVFAGGDPQQVEGARKAFRNALIGYALAVLAPVLVGIAKSILQG